MPGFEKFLVADLGSLRQYYAQFFRTCQDRSDAAKLFVGEPYFLVFYNTSSGQWAYRKLGGFLL